QPAAQPRPDIAPDNVAASAASWRPDRSPNPAVYLLNLNLQFAQGDRPAYDRQPHNPADRLANTLNCSRAIARDRPTQWHQLHTCAGEDADAVPEAIAWINNPVAAQPRPQVLDLGMVKAHRKFLQSSSLKSLPIPELACLLMTMNRRKRPYGCPPDDVAAILYSVPRYWH